MTATKKIGIIGCGTIGQKVAVELDKGSVPGASLAAMSSRDLDKVRFFTKTLSAPPAVVELKDLVPIVDIVVETEYLEYCRQRVCELRHGKNWIASDSVGGVAAVAHFTQREEIAQQLRDREPRNRLPKRRAMRFEYPDTLRPTLFGKLQHETTLSNSGGAFDSDNQAGLVVRALQ